MIEIAMKKRKKEIEAETGIEKEVDLMEGEAGHMEKADEVGRETIKDAAVAEAELEAETEEEMIKMRKKIIS